MCEVDASQSTVGRPLCFYFIFYFLILGLDCLINGMLEEGPSSAAAAAAAVAVLSTANTHTHEHGENEPHCSNNPQILVIFIHDMVIIN